MIENEKSGGYPIDDEELDNVSGGMRVQVSRLCIVNCPVCGSSDTACLYGARRLCRVYGCGTIFQDTDGKVVGVEPTIANHKP